MDQDDLEAAAGGRPRAARRRRPQRAAGQRVRVPGAAQGAADRRGHVRTALARFDQVRDVSDADRDRAFANIRKAAEHFGVDVAETDWRQLGKRPHTRTRPTDRRRALSRRRGRRAAASAAASGRPAPVARCRVGAVRRRRPAAAGALRRPPTRRPAGVADADHAAAGQAGRGSTPPGIVAGPGHHDDVEVGPGQRRGVRRADRGGGQPAPPAQRLLDAPAGTRQLVPGLGQPPAPLGRRPAAALAEHLLDRRHPARRRPAPARSGPRPAGRSAAAPAARAGAAPACPGRRTGAAPAGRRPPAPSWSSTASASRSSSADPLLRLLEPEPAVEQVQRGQPVVQAGPQVGRDGAGLHVRPVAVPDRAGRERADPLDQPGAQPAGAGEPLAQRPDRTVDAVPGRSHEAARWRPAGAAGRAAGPPAPPRRRHPRPAATAPRPSAAAARRAARRRRGRPGSTRRSRRPPARSGPAAARPARRAPARPGRTGTSRVGRLAGQRGQPVGQRAHRPGVVHHQPAVRHPRAEVDGSVSTRQLSSATGPSRPRTRRPPALSRTGASSTSGHLRRRVDPVEAAAGAAGHPGGVHGEGGRHPVRRGRRQPASRSTLARTARRARPCCRRRHAHLRPRPLQPSVIGRTRMATLPGRVARAVTGRPPGRAARTARPPAAPTSASRARRPRSAVTTSAVVPAAAPRRRPRRACRPRTRARPPARPARPVPSSSTARAAPSTTTRTRGSTRSSAAGVDPRRQRGRRAGRRPAAPARPAAGGWRRPGPATSRRRRRGRRPRSPRRPPAAARRRGPQPRPGRRRSRDAAAALCTASASTQRTSSLSPPVGRGSAGATGLAEHGAVRPAAVVVDEHTGRAHRGRLDAGLLGGLPQRRGDRRLVAVAGAARQSPGAALVAPPGPVLQDDPVRRPGPARGRAAAGRPRRTVPSAGGRPSTAPSRRRRRAPGQPASRPAQRGRRAGGRPADQQGHRGAGDQAADVRLPADVRDREGDDQVDPDQHADAAGVRADPLAQHDQRAEEPEDRAGRADAEVSGGLSASASSEPPSAEAR